MPQPPQQPQVYVNPNPPADVYLGDHLDQASHRMCTMQRMCNAQNVVSSMLENPLNTSEVLQQVEKKVEGLKSPEEDKRDLKERLERLKGEREEIENRRKGVREEIKVARNATWAC